MKASYLTGKYLLAMPSLADPRFHKAVILICAHDENGAMGLVVNHPLRSMTFSGLVKQLPFDDAEKAKLEAMDLPLFTGGPVESARGFLLHSNEILYADTIRVGDHFGVTGTLDSLKTITPPASMDDPKPLFILGHAGWTAGQIEQEIQDNAWLVSDADPAIVFDQNYKNKWTLATRKMGIDPALLSSEAGRA